MSKKVLKVCICVLVTIALLLVLMIKIINTNSEKNSLYTSEDLELINQSVDNYLSDKITPRGIAKLYGAYSGDNDINDMYRGIYRFVNYLPELSENVKYDDLEKINEFYNENLNKIKENLGIVNQEDFVKFIEFLNKSNYHGEKFIDCQLDSKTFKNKNSYFTFEITFNFEKLDSDFRLLLHFSNNNHTQPEIYFSIIEENVENGTENIVEETNELKNGIIEENTIVE